MACLGAACHASCVALPSHLLLHSLHAPSCPQEGPEDRPCPQDRRSLPCACLGRSRKRKEHPLAFPGRAASRPAPSTGSRLQRSLLPQQTWLRSVSHAHPSLGRRFIPHFPSFVVVSLLNTRHHTPVIKRNANPEYSLKDATFDFPIYLSLADRLGTIEIVVWDKDNMLRKEYLGEVALPLEDWFMDGNAFGFGDDRNKVHSTVQLASLPLMSFSHHSRHPYRLYLPGRRRSPLARSKSNLGLSHPRIPIH